MQKNLEKSTKNVSDGRRDVFVRGALVLPFSESSFDVVAAFETVCFWLDNEKCFCGIYRVLKPNGCFMI